MTAKAFMTAVTIATLLLCGCAHATRANTQTTTIKDTRAFITANCVLNQEPESALLATIATIAATAAIDKGIDYVSEYMKKEADASKEAKVISATGVHVKDKNYVENISEACLTIIHGEFGKPAKPNAFQEQDWLPYGETLTEKFSLADTPYIFFEGIIKPITTNKTDNEESTTYLIQPKIFVYNKNIYETTFDKSRDILISFNFTSISNENKPEASSTQIIFQDISPKTHLTSSAFVGKRSGMFQISRPIGNCSAKSIFSYKIDIAETKDANKILQASSGAFDSAKGDLKKAIIDAVKSEIKQ